MNHVERFCAVMDFQPVDRLPRIEWACWWDKTIDRWKMEGLPEDFHAAFDISQHLGLDPYQQYWIQPILESVTATLEHGMGLISNLEDYLSLKPNLYVQQETIIESMKPYLDQQAKGDTVVWITLEGFFWFPRTLFGIEQHLYAFYDHAELMHRINQDLAEYHLSILNKISQIGSPVFMTFAEDMSYNHGPMLSRQQFDEFLAPYYRQVVPVLKEMGTFVFVDTDGDVTAMIPWLEDVGIQGVLPLERQAGVDAVTLRQQYPRFRMIGHYDKMVMPRGEEAIRNEFERLVPVMRSGGFIPGVDHQTPPGVSLEQYRCYLKLLKEYCQLNHM